MDFLIEQKKCDQRINELGIIGKEQMASETKLLEYWYQSEKRDQGKKKRVVRYFYVDDDESTRLQV